MHTGTRTRPYPCPTPTCSEDYHSLDSSAAGLGQPFFPASASSRRRLGSAAANRVSLTLLLGSTLPPPRNSHRKHTSGAGGVQSELHVPPEVLWDLLFLAGNQSSSASSSSLETPLGSGVAANLGCSLCFATRPPPTPPVGTQTPSDWRLGAFRFDDEDDHPYGSQTSAGRAEELCIQLSLDPETDASVGRAARRMLRRRGFSLSSSDDGVRPHQQQQQQSRDRECLEQPWVYLEHPVPQTKESLSGLGPLRASSLTVCGIGEDRAEVLAEEWQDPEDPFLNGWLEALIHGQHGRHLKQQQSPRMARQTDSGPHPESTGSQEPGHRLDWLLDRTALVTKQDPLLPITRRFHVLVLPPGFHEPVSGGRFTLS